MSDSEKGVNERSFWEERGGENEGEDRTNLEVDSMFATLCDKRFTASE